MELTLSFQTTILFNAAYAGSQEESLPFIQPILDLHPTAQNFPMIPWKDVTAQSLFSSDLLTCEKGNLYGVGVKTLDVATFKKFTTNFTSFFYQFPGTTSSLFFSGFFPTWAVMAVLNDATAYPHR